jgi:hypothetical protein
VKFWIPTFALALLTVVILLAMRSGWQRKKAATQAAVGPLPPAPASFGTARTAPAEATYLGSTLAGQWLERIPAQGLAERANGTVQLFDAGLQLVRQGTNDLYIPFDRIEAVRFDRGIAGKVSDPERLVVVTWRLAIVVDTGILLRHPQQAQELVTALQGAVQQKEAG